MTLGLDLDRLRTVSSGISEIQLGVIRAQEEIDDHLIDTNRYDIAAMIVFLLCAMFYLLISNTD